MVLMTYSTIIIIKHYHHEAKPVLENSSNKYCVMYPMHDFDQVSSDQSHIGEKVILILIAMIITMTVHVHCNSSSLMRFLLG